MRQPARRRRLVLVTLIGLLLGLAPSASAHVTKTSGSYRVSVGWGNEPPYAGLENFVEVGVTDASGTPVSAPAGALDVEVSFGEARTTLPLRPAEEPGSFRAVLVPTRPGTYAFHVTGTVRGQPIDTGATCSDQTFECVGAVSEVEFPVKDPSIGELAQRVSRELPRAGDATDTADSAQRIAIGAIVLAGLALAAGLVLGLRRSAKNE